MVNIYNNLKEEEIKVSYWYVTHRVLLRKISIMVLAVAAGALLLYGVFGLLNYYIVDRGKILEIENAISAEKLNISLLAEINKPKDLMITETRVLKGAEGTYDIISEVINPNIQWQVESFDYYYLIGEEKTNIKEDFILPEQSKYVLYLNYPSARSFSSAELVLENIKWKKVADYKSLEGKIIQFDFQNKIVLSPTESGLTEKESVAVVRFDVLNKSAYNFWEPRFVILLYRGNTLIGVTQTVLDGLAFGEKKTETIHIFQSLPFANRIDIIPDINILDPDVFKGFDFQAGEPK